MAHAAGRRHVPGVKPVAVPSCGRERGLLGQAEPSLTHGGQTMGEYSEVFVAFVAAKVKRAVAISEGRRTGEIRFRGEIENRTGPIERTIRKLAGRYARPHV